MYIQRHPGLGAAAPTPTNTATTTDYTDHIHARSSSQITRVLVIANIWLPLFAIGARVCCAGSYTAAISAPVRPRCFMGGTGRGIAFVNPAWPQRRSYCDKARLSESGNGGDGGRAPYITKAKVARLVSPASAASAFPRDRCLARVSYFVPVMSCTSLWQFQWHCTILNHGTVTSCWLVIRSNSVCLTVAWSCWESAYVQ